MANAVASKQDYERMTPEEYADLRELLAGLSEDQWDAPSLCAGWKVRHVVGHICLGSQISPFVDAVQDRAVRLQRREGVERALVPLRRRRTRPGSSSRPSTS